MGFVTVTVEGGIFPPDFIEKLATSPEDLPGQKPHEFGVSDGRLSDEIQNRFSEFKKLWDLFKLRRENREPDKLLALTRDKWVREVLEAIGYSVLNYQRSPLMAGDTVVSISHLAGEDKHAPPVHIVSYERDLDRRNAGEPRSPHSNVQDYLNRSDALWGIVTNGRQWRLLRDSARLSRPTYVEFDLEAMLESNSYSEFILFYRLLHRSRLPQTGTESHECWLEKYYLQGLSEGNRVRDHLRDGVTNALIRLGKGIIEHPENTALREKLKTGELDATGYYRELLRIIYRLLFLLVAEERRLVFATDPKDSARHEIYSRYYSVSRLRNIAEAHGARDHHGDLWQGLIRTFRLFRDEQTAGQLGLTALNGELFGESACPAVESTQCSNRDLLEAIWQLGTFEETTGRRGRKLSGVRRRVNYAGLDVEELGSVYESLLDFHPVVTADPPDFDLSWGSERKTTGSYYTPPELVRELIQSALVPVMEDRLKGKKTREEQEEALLTMKVVDPAAGSGHFLLAAARRIGRELAKVRAEGHEPSPKEFREAVRDVVSHCIYGVDLNPMAVELCKVALWMEAMDAGRPLSFLDHRIKHGNSLIGATPKLLAGGIPDAAFEPIEGDDKKVASALKKRNKEERKIREAGSTQFDFGGSEFKIGNLAQSILEITTAGDETVEEYHEKQRRYENLVHGSTYKAMKLWADAWCAAFVQEKTQKCTLNEIAFTDRDFQKMEKNPSHAPLKVREEINRLAAQYGFFHWHLEFPDVFRIPVGTEKPDNEQSGWSGGFDAVIGNPPWEKIQTEELQFFASAAPEIISLKGARRKAAIDVLTDTRPELAKAWLTQRRFDAATAAFVRSSDSYPFTGQGKFNSFALFAELKYRLIGDVGRVGTIVPSGIATDDTTKFFFQKLIDSKCLASLLDFENRDGIFPSVDSRFKFCLLTFSGRSRPQHHAEFVFFAHRVSDLIDDTRRFTLTPDDFKLLNPNTRTCPIFRSKCDAEITKRTYRRVAILEVEGNDNPWKPSLRRILNETDDSAQFKSNVELISGGYEVRNKESVSTKGGVEYLRFYEAKLIWQYDHRYSTYEITSESLLDVTADQHANSEMIVQPWNWYPISSLQQFYKDGSIPNWSLVFRRITNVTNERTLIFGIVPRSAVGTLLPTITLESDSMKVACFLGEKNSFSFDYIARQKISGTDVNLFKIKQLPSLPPQSYDKQCPWENVSYVSWILPRVLELTSTAWDMVYFASDCGHDGSPFVWDEQRRFLIRCELDAAYFHLYLGGEDEWNKGNSTDLLAELPLPRNAVEYIMESFPIVKRKDEQVYGEYRTKRVILEIYDEMTEAIRTGKPYQTRLDPPPGDPRCAHPESTRPDWAKKPETREKHKPTVGLPVIHGLPSWVEIPDGAWATPDGLSEDNREFMILAAALQVMGKPARRNDVRLLGALISTPSLCTALLTTDDSREWVRVVGKEAREGQHKVVSFARVRPEDSGGSWRKAVEQLRASGHILEDDGAKTWAPSPALSSYPVQAWVVGRAKVAVEIIKLIGDQASRGKLYAFYKEKLPAEETNQLVS